jgi:hypothetical protein
VLIVFETFTPPGHFLDVMNYSEQCFSTQTILRAGKISKFSNENSQNYEGINIYKTLKYTWLLLFTILPSFGSFITKIKQMKIKG